LGLLVAVAENRGADEICYIGGAMKIDLSDYSAAGPIAARAAALAKASGARTILKATSPGTATGDIDFIRHGRWSWVEWWGHRLKARRSR
jgi:hypothetical protein